MKNIFEKITWIKSLAILTLICPSVPISASAEENGHEVSLRCPATTLSKNPVYVGPNHAEFNLARDSNHSNTDAPIPRVAVTKGRKCEIEFSATRFGTDITPFTGTFDSAYNQDPLGGQPLSGISIIPQERIVKIIEDISPSLKACNQKFEKINRTYESSDFGKRMSKSEVKEWARAASERLRCERQAIKLLDYNGFIGVNFNGDNHRVFVWDGAKLYIEK